MRISPMVTTRPSRSSRSPCGMSSITHSAGGVICLYSPSLAKHELYPRQTYPHTTIAAHPDSPARDVKPTESTHDGDGFVTTQPDREMLQRFRDSGGDGKPAQGGYKVCWSNDEETAVATAHRLWSTSGLPGELSQVLPSPRHFEQASALATEQMTRHAIA